MNPVATISKPEISTIELAMTPTCCHHWLIEPPNGPTSHGVCRLCGEEKEFNNFAQKLNPKKISLARSNHQRTREYGSYFSRAI